MKKIIMVQISIAFIALLGLNVSAESVTDPSGDVWHWNNTGSAWGWDYNTVGKSNIDVTDISYVVDGEQVTLTMTVAGTITNSELVSYWTYLNTSDSNYFFSWSNNEGMGWGTNTEEGSFQMDFEPEITARGNKVTAVFDVIGTFQTGIEVWGWAAEYTTYGNTATEWWADWVPNEKSPYYDVYLDDSGDTSVDDSGDDGTGDDTGSDDTGSADSGDTANADENTNVPPPSGTPGFEFLALFTAFAAILFIVKKRK